MAYVSTVNNLLLIERPIAAEYVGPLQQQPSLMAVDEKVRPKKLRVTVQYIVPLLNIIHSSICFFSERSYKYQNGCQKYLYY